MAFSIGLIGRAEAFLNLWQKAIPFIEKALYHSNAELTTQDVLSKILNDTMQLWIIKPSEREEVLGVAVTEVLDYPQISRLRVVLLGGTNMPEWQEELCEKLMAYAKYLGLSGIEAYGRPGLFTNLKKLGFRPVYVAFLRDVEKSEPPPTLAFSRIEEELING